MTRTPAIQPARAHGSDACKYSEILLCNGTAVAAGTVVLTSGLGASVSKAGVAVSKEIISAGGGECPTVSTVVSVNPSRSGEIKDTLDRLADVSINRKVTKGQAIITMNARR
jgi:hypothetical protein